MYINRLLVISLVLLSVVAGQNNAPGLAIASARADSHCDHVTVALHSVDQSMPSLHHNVPKTYDAHNEIRDHLHGRKAYSTQNMN